MRTISTIAYLVLLMSLGFGLLHMLGADFVEALTAFLFGDYERYAQAYISMPGWGHPFVWLIVLAVLVTLLPGLLNLTRFVAMVFIAICITRAAFLVLGLGGASPPSLTTLIAAFIAIGWLLLTGALMTIGTRNRASAS